MRWQHKAKIMHICATLPWGNLLYKQLQKRFGRLRAAPLNRLPMQVEMVRWLNQQGKSVEGASLFEVGTGHIPLVPIGFFLSGAKQIITVDLHRRIEWGLVRKSLKWIVDHREDIERLYTKVVPKAVFDERFAVLERTWYTPTQFFDEAGLEYYAPMDAANTSLPSHSVDYHFSVTTLEHIPKPVLRDIFLEAKRLLTPNGLAIHFVDLSDHFQHQDSSISRINFLRFSEEHWLQLAGNEFAYCNRLRASDYLSLFAEVGFEVLRVEQLVDKTSLKLLQNGFAVASKFNEYDLDDLAVTSLRLMLLPIEAA